MDNRAGPQTEKWENLNGTKFFLLSLTIKMTWKKFGSLEINFSWWDLKLKKMAFLHSKNEVKISKKRKMAKNDFSRSDLGS